ncbi:hypothetical protein D3C87_2172340 [compost metagenome]
MTVKASIEIANIAGIIPAIRLRMKISMDGDPLVEEPGRKNRPGKRTGQFLK